LLWIWASWPYSSLSKDRSGFRDRHALAAAIGAKSRKSHWTIQAFPWQMDKKQR
jgi:hypothetical protein